MKKVLTTALIFSLGFLFAQQDVIKTDYIKTVEEGKTKVYLDGEWIHRNVKIITLKEEKVKFDQKDRYKLNQDRVEAPIEVTKIVMTDNDQDQYYDDAYLISYRLNKDNALLSQSTVLPTRISLDTDSFKNIENFTGEVILTDERDFKITALDDSEEEFEFILTY
ncbi:hypothetical protein [Tenacibaculum jejuense]|uniref:Lipoprotein n=1 Tax=Tenacibaculum jejuense TaxID=584609 RepID=A0A238UCH0_9FLAO|nr:hypothetical protein [Tenacibaculum jejuense]SNR16755.1 exported protein of unknown function [Tenacibaculum jejuense]